MTEMNMNETTLNLLVEHNGKIYMVGMDKEKLEAIEFLVRRSADVLIPTSKTQSDLLEFLEYNR